LMHGIEMHSTERRRRRRAGASFKIRDSEVLTTMIRGHVHAVECGRTVMLWGKREVDAHRRALELRSKRQVCLTVRFKVS